MAPRSPSGAGRAQEAINSVPGTAESRPGLIVARLLAAFALVGAALAVLRPFLVPLAWAALVAYITWPVYRALRVRAGGPRIAATLFTAAAALVAGVPLIGILVALAGEATEMVAALQSWVSQGSPLPAWLDAWPPLAHLAGWLQTHAVPESAALGDWLARNGTRFSAHLAQVAGGVARHAMEFAVTFVALYVFYIEGERIVATATRLAVVLFPTAPSRFVEQIGGSIRGVVFGLLGTALAQGVLAGAAFAIAGVPSPVALGVATTALSFVPAGPTVLGLGSALWLLANGRMAAAIAIGLWMLVVVASIDNVLRPLLISGPTRIPFLLVFFGVLGGIGWLGLLGIFVGPVLLSVAFTLLVDFSRRAPSVQGRTAPAADS